MPRARGVSSSRLGGGTSTAAPPARAQVTIHGTVHSQLGAWILLASCHGEQLVALLAQCSRQHQPGMARSVPAWLPGPGPPAPGCPPCCAAPFSSPAEARTQQAARQHENETLSPSSQTKPCKPPGPLTVRGRAGRQDALRKPKIVQLHNQALPLSVLKAAEQYRAGAQRAVHHAALVAVGQRAQRAAAD